MPTPTLNIVDIFLFCFLLFFLLDGWRKGFLKSVLGPLIFIVCSIGGMIYFDLTQNFVKAILLTTSTSMFLTIVLLILFNLGKRSVDPTYRDYSPLLGRFLGSIVNVFWQGAILFIIVFLIPLAPLQIFGLNKMQSRIQQSFCYSYITAKLSEVPAVKGVITAFSIFENPDAMQELSSTQEFQNFFSNKKVQLLVNDENFMEKVRRRDMSKILGDPRILDIFGDDYLMDNFGQLAKKIYLKNLPAEK